MLKETVLYCGKNQDGTYEDFYKYIAAVEMCGFEEEDIIKVKVREATKEEKPTHYAWWDNKENEFEFIFPSWLQVDMCFPYGSKIEVETGTGNILGIVVEEVGQ
jgi:hypothetical protein